MVTWAQAIPTASYILVAAWAARHLIERYERRKSTKRSAQLTPST